MTHPPLARVLMLVALAAIGTAIDARASDPDLLVPHIRAPDPQMRALIEDATRRSAIVRALIERLTASDVVVFVECERDPAVRAPGRLNFVTAAGGLRYVIIRLKLRQPRTRTIAVLGHELQHAAEIADTPAIVDADSLAREYSRIGYRSHAAHGGTAFDTRAAVDIGRRILEELDALKASAGD